MRYKTTNIGDEGVDVAVDVTASWLAEHCPELDGGLAPEGLALSGRLERTGEDFLLRGNLRGALQMSCARCLEPTRVGIDVPITVSFVEAPAEAELAADEGEDGDFVRFSEGLIDLSDELREEIFLALPMSPRCEPECLGMCPHCGVNRDKSPCDCEERQRAEASPFATLAKLKS